MSHMIPSIGGTQIDANVKNIADYHKRNLNEWNFAEHFEPNVFAQVWKSIRSEDRRIIFFSSVDYRTSSIHSFTCGCLLQSTR